MLNLIESYQNKYQRDVFFLDQKGKATLHSSSFSGNIDLNHSLADGSTIKDKLLTQKSATIEFWQGDKKILLNSRYIEEFDWYLVIRQNSQSIDNDLFDSLMLSLLV